jgi:hypothetical protein
VRIGLGGLVVGVFSCLTKIVVFHPVSMPLIKGPLAACTVITPPLPKHGSVSSRYDSYVIFCSLETLGFIFGIDFWVQR